MDAQYRQRFSAQDKWWLALQFGSASDAFKSIPEILAVKDSGRGTFFIPARSTGPVVRPSSVGPALAGKSAGVLQTTALGRFATKVAAFLVAGKHTSAGSAVLISQLGDTKQSLVPAELKGQKLVDLLKRTDCSTRGIRIVSQSTTSKGAKGATVWIISSSSESDGIENDGDGRERSSSSGSTGAAQDTSTGTGRTGGGPAADVGIAGFLFVCSPATEGECLSRKLFGLGAARFKQMQCIGEGTKIFLLNIKTRVVHGIYSVMSRATSWL
jgi:hypothetical protein